jgi:predicted O-methyltransferase YrrM
MKAATRTLDELDAALANTNGSDPYAWIRTATDAHRAIHECWAYPFDDGRLLGAAAKVVVPSYVLELGTALGYTACWWTTGGPKTHVDTVELDPEHVRLARQNLATAGVAERVNVLHGDFVDVLPTLTPRYDLAFFDGYAPTPEMFELIAYLVKPGGVLVTSNLELGGKGFRKTLAADASWQTRFVLDTGFSVRAADPA